MNVKNTNKNASRKENTIRRNVAPFFLNTLPVIKAFSSSAIVRGGGGGDIFFQPKY
jgi:hypothetical protein